MTPKTLTLTKAAQHLGIPKRTFYNMLSSKRFPVDPLPGLHPRRWSVEDLDAWLASAKGASKSADQ